MPFNDLSLDPRLMRSVQHLGFVKPTDIQQEAIPAVMVGRDLIVSSQTGSGKTLAYLLPMMQRLLKSRPLSKRDARALILAPTRELARQVYAQLRLFVANTPLTSALIVGGENFNDQEKLLKREPAIIVATPGRFVDHLEHKSVFINGLEMLILDEAVAALDPLVQKLVLEMLLDLQKTRGLSYVFITHNLEVARAISHRIIYLEKGEKKALPAEWMRV